MKRIFSIGTMLKLFFLTSISTANPLVSCTSHPTEKVAEVKGTNDEKGTPAIHLTEDSFKKLIFNYDKNKDWKFEGNKPVIIDFYADWCAPCRQLSPIMEELAKDYAGKIVVYKVDTEKEKTLSGKLGITALPTLIFIPVNGEPQASMGALPKETLVKAINEVLKVK